MLTKYTNLGKIDLIKNVRAAGRNAKLVQVPNTETFTLEADVLGLKDAKDLIESAMALGVRCYLEDQLRAQQDAVKKPFSYSDLSDQPQF